MNRFQHNIDKTYTSFKTKQIYQHNIIRKLCTIHKMSVRFYAKILNRHEHASK